MVNQMKKISIISMILLFTLITCDKRESSNGVKIYVDPRIEFISIVFSMTSWDRMIDEWLEHDYKDYAYFREIEKTFHPFRSHKAIMIAESLVVKHKFYWDAIPEFILFHNNPPELKQIRAYDNEIIERAGDEKILNEFVEALRDFASVTDFFHFYDAHAKFYNALVNEVGSKFQGKKLVKTLENFFGWKLKSYNVVLAPCMHPMGGYGLRIPDDGNYHSYEIVRVDGIQNDFPSFGDVNSIYHLALHEFGHSYVNPATNKYLGQIKALRELYQIMEDTLKQNISDNWIDKFNEQLLNSFTVYVNRIEGDSIGAENAIRYHEKKQGLYLTRKIAGLYDVYSQNRDKYPTFDKFYPVIIKTYKESATDISPIQK